MSVRPTPDLRTIGGRLRAERMRMGFTQTAFADIAGASKRALFTWEKDAASPNANALAAFDAAGADTLFILTGRSATPPASELDEGAIRAALSALEAVDRQWLLLSLVALEMRS